MKIHHFMAISLYTALFITLCLPSVCMSEIMPLAETGNVIRVTISFSSGKAISVCKVGDITAGCTASSNS